MPFGRFLVSWNKVSGKPEDAFTNTLYFNITQESPIDPPDWQQLCTDLAAVYRSAGANFVRGRELQVRAYDMADAKPRPLKAIATSAPVGTAPTAPAQVAVALSYYADRNLPRQRGRIYTGPWTCTSELVDTATINALVSLANGFFNLGGVNVDWSLYSPTTGEHTRINHGWVDNSWDIIRSRKVDATLRTTFSGDG